MEASHGQFLDEVGFISAIIIILILITLAIKFLIILVIIFLITLVIMAILLSSQVKRSEEAADSWEVAPSKIPVGAFR